MDKLTLEHLAPYLPYGVNLAFVLRDEIRYVGKITSIVDIEDYDTIKIKVGYNDAEHIWMFKPILRRLSDIDKLITVGEESFEPSTNYDLVKDEDGLWCDEFSADYSESPTALVPITFLNQWLFKYHFDVFGLIAAGLAVDINTIEDGKA